MSRTKNLAPSVKKRMEIERKIIRTFCKEAIAQGYKLSLHDGEEMVLVKTNVLHKIMQSIQSTDEDTIYFYHPDRPDHCAGYVNLVYGNDGYDVIQDYAGNLEPLFHTAQQIAEAHGA